MRSHAATLVLVLAAASSVAAVDAVQLWYPNGIPQGVSTNAPGVWESIVWVTKSGEDRVCTSGSSDSNLSFYSEYSADGKFVTSFSCNSNDCSSGCTGDRHSADGQGAYGAFKVLASGSKLSPSEIQKVKPQISSSTSYFVTVNFGTSDCSGDPISGHIQHLYPQCTAYQGRFFKTVFNANATNTLLFSDNSCSGAGDFFQSVFAIPADAPGSTASCIFSTLRSPKLVNVPGSQPPSPSSSSSPVSQPSSAPTPSSAKQGNGAAMPGALAVLAAAMSFAGLIAAV
nr:hypothetical protein HK105_006793 [Polyrhizophydium stewartii]